MQCSKIVTQDCLGAPNETKQKQKKLLASTLPPPSPILYPTSIGFPKPRS